jgi:hypothetical protein
VAGPALTALAVGDRAAAWEALGFAVSAGGDCRLGAVTLHLGARGEGIVGWRLDGRGDGDGLLDGLPELSPGVQARAERPAGPHPNGALGLDHVVIATPDLARTVAALERAGLDLRRRRETRLGEVPLRQAFFVAGDCLLEVAGPPEPTGDGPARFWGLTVVVSDLDALARELGPRLGEPRPAVQPGRRIATLRAAAGLSTATAFMTPR